MSASKLRFYHRLQVAAHAVRKVSDRAVAEATGITTAQAAVMRIVADGDQVSQREVATALALNESAITAMAARLMKLGFLERARSSRDSRAWVLKVTPHGDAAMRAARAAFNHINARIEREFSKNELEALVEFLDRLATAFQGSPQSASPSAPSSIISASETQRARTSLKRAKTRTPSTTAAR